MYFQYVILVLWDGSPKRASDSVPKAWIVFKIQHLGQGSVQNTVG
jgi:hypothetical protein